MVVIPSPRAEAAPPGERHFRRAPGVLASLAGVVGAPLVFLAGQLLAYATVPRACVAGGSRLPLHVEHALIVLLLLACAAISAREWRRAGREWPDDGWGPLPRSRFLAAGGTALALFLVVIAAAQWVAVGVFPPCVGA